VFFVLLSDELLLAEAVEETGETGSEGGVGGVAKGAEVGEERGDEGLQGRGGSLGGKQFPGELAEEGVAETLVQQGRNLSDVDLPVLLVVLVPHELDRVVGLDVLEHRRPVLQQLFGREEGEDLEVEFEDEGDVSRVLLALARPHALLQQRTLLLLHFQQSQQDTVEAESGLLPVGVHLQFAGSDQADDVRQGLLQLHSEAHPRSDLLDQRDEVVAANRDQGLLAGKSHYLQNGLLGRGLQTLRVALEDLGKQLPPSP
jgi:hypothetical protein